MRAHRLTDQHAALSWSERLEHMDDISHVRLAGEIRRPARAASVAALVHEQNTERVRERFGRGKQLSRAAGESMKQEDRRTGTAEVCDGERDVAPLKRDRRRQPRPAL